MPAARTQKLWLILVLLLVVVIVAFGYWCNYFIAASSIGPLHRSTLKEMPEFLTDELALTKAREALIAEGYDLSIWKAEEQRRSSSPNGTADVYLVRNIDPNQGWIEFRNFRGSRGYNHRVVQVKLTDHGLECRIIKPPEQPVSPL